MIVIPDIPYKAIAQADKVCEHIFDLLEKINRSLKNGGKEGRISL